MDLSVLVVVSALVALCMPVYLYFTSGVKVENQHPTKHFKRTAKGTVLVPVVRKGQRYTAEIRNGELVRLILIDYTKDRRRIF